VKIKSGVTLAANRFSNRFAKSVQRLITLALLIALTSCAGTAPAATVAAPVSTAVIVNATAATLSAGALSYSIDVSQSLVKYLATGPLNVQYPGTFKVAGQSIVLIPEANGYHVKLLLTLDLKSATATDSFMRNTLLNSLEADRYPVAVFDLTSENIVAVSPDSTASMTAVPIRVVLRGSYTLHNHQQLIELLVTLLISSAGLQMNGSMTFKLSDYGVQISGFVVSDSITFTAALTAKRANS